MKLVLLIVLGLFLPLTSLKGDVDPNLVKYVNEYEDIVKPHCERSSAYKRNKNQLVRTYISDHFDDYGVNVPERAVGVCVKDERMGVRLLLVRASYWNKITEVEKRALLYHELSHCTLDKRHIDDPANYMYPVTREVDIVQLIIQVSNDAKEFCSKPRKSAKK
jgi:hypothetical protein